jgi:hypothetical protein
MLALRPTLEQRGGKMTVSQTSNSAAEQKRMERLDIARRLYQAMITHDPDRLIILRDSGGRVLACHDPRPEQPNERVPS